MRPLRFLWAYTKLFYARLMGYETLTPFDILDDRLYLCNQCPFLDREKGECQACGCPVEAKALLATEECPKKKWLSRWVRKPH